MSRRWPKPSVDTARSIGINGLIRAGYLRQTGSSWKSVWTDWRGEPVIALTFVYGHDRRLTVTNAAGADQVVQIIHKPCGLASWRQHFACPIPGCGRGVDLLYVARFRDHDDGLGCRHCLELSRAGRPVRRMANLRARHGLGLGPLDPVIRPKGMHRKTFEKLNDKLHGLTAAYVRSSPILANIHSRITADMAALPAALEVVIEALRSLGTTQDDAGAEKIWAAYDSFYERFGRFLSEAQRAQILEAFPSAPPRFYGGVGDQKKYRPPRPAWRRKPRAPQVSP